MTTIKKTIQINPELFKMGGAKTRKNKEKKEVPLIRPSNLKNKLLNRIKEHKNNEFKEKSSISNESKEYTDEFYGALDYLSDLSKKHKKDSEKMNYERTNAKSNTSDERNKTLKNYNSSPHVELELPPELQVPYSPDFNRLSQNDVFPLKYKVDNEVPHGCLKNGQKPTYKTWKNQTRKSNHIENMIPEMNNTIQPQETLMTREQRLEMIKKKLKKMESFTNTNTAPKQNPKINFIPIQTKSIEENINVVPVVANQIYGEPELLSTPTPINSSNSNSIPKQEENENNNTSNFILRESFNISSDLPIKNKIKKTIKKTYTLGKSNIYRKVGILIKDKATRKKILNAHKDLKKVSIADVKKYLRTQGILKVGSTAPNDVLRKTYESARLAGEITNTNKDTLLHNFLNGDDINTNSHN